MGPKGSVRNERVEGMSWWCCLKDTLLMRTAAGLQLKTACNYGYGCCCCCFIEEITPPLLNKVTSWDIKVLRLRDNMGEVFWLELHNLIIFMTKSGVLIAIILCWTLYFLMIYVNKEYGLRGENGKYVHTKDTAAIDLIKDETSFILSRVNIGTSFKRNSHW